MKKTTFLVLTLFIFLAGRGQNSSQILKYTIPKLAIDSIAEELANIALQNPEIKSFEASSTAAEYTWKASKYQLLNSITVAGNLNEYSINKTNNNLGVNGTNLLYPRYNFGIRVPIGELFSSPRITKANYYKLQSEEEIVKLTRNRIRKDVIILFQNYATTQKLIALQQEVLQDESVAFTKAEERFKNGETSLESYTLTSKAYNNEQVKLVNLTKDLKVYQASLEELLGMPLEDAFAHIKAIYEQNIINSNK